MDQRIAPKRKASRVVANDDRMTNLLPALAPKALPSVACVESFILIVHISRQDECCIAVNSEERLEAFKLTEFLPTFRCRPRGD
jgi:hypothetical protein